MSGNKKRGGDVPTTMARGVGLESADERFRDSGGGVVSAKRASTKATFSKRSDQKRVGRRTFGQ